MLDIVYLLFAFFTVIATLTALVRGRALGWLVPLWFLTSLVATELALPLLLLELLVLLTAGGVLRERYPGVLEPLSINAVDFG